MLVFGVESVKSKYTVLSFMVIVNSRWIQQFDFELVDRDRKTVLLLSTGLGNGTHSQQLHGPVSLGFGNKIFNEA
jgi:hypothetical protein